jgi:tRNA(Arg) A34 adenosine deaminase TadA
LRPALLGLAESGIPIGSVLVCDRKIIGRGHNGRVQKSSPILHGEMDCLENAGRLPASGRRSTIYTTISPCPMCSGAILLFRIPHVNHGPSHAAGRYNVEAIIGRAATGTRDFVARYAEFPNNLSASPLPKAPRYRYFEPSLRERRRWPAESLRSKWADPSPDYKYPDSESRPFCPGTADGAL